MTKFPKHVSEYFKRQGAKGGQKGGPARAASLPPERRSEIARNAAAARWKHQKTVDSI